MITFLSGNNISAIFGIRRRSFGDNRDRTLGGGWVYSFLIFLFGFLKKFILGKKKLEKTKKMFSKIKVHSQV